MTTSRYPPHPTQYPSYHTNQQLTCMVQYPPSHTIHSALVLRIAPSVHLGSYPDSVPDIAYRASRQLAPHALGE
eukprot:620678-Rhodomonas_salina.1